VKLKRNTSGQLNDTIDVVLLGYYRGKGKRAEFGAGALLAGVYDTDKDEFQTISKLGTGFPTRGGVRSPATEEPGGRGEAGPSELDLRPRRLAEARDRGRGAG